MSKPTFAERCQLAQMCLPDAPYRAMLTALHSEMLTALAAQQQEPEIDGATMAGMDASIGHLSALVDELRLLLGCAMDNFKMLHNAAKPDDGPDMDAIIPAIVFAKFVNQDAALRYAIKHSAHDGMIAAPPAQPAQPQQEPTTGNWYSAKEIDAMVRDLDIAMHGEGAAPQAKLCDLMPTLIKRLAEQPAQRTDDTKRLDALAENSWDLRCFDMPTGADDADIGWRAIEHHMAKPQERTVAEVFRDDPRQAIDAAIEAAAKTKDTP